MNNPINETKYTRHPIPNSKQAVFTSKLSGAGQGVVPASVRNGRDTDTDFKLVPGCKVELQIKAVWYEVIVCIKCGADIVLDGQGHKHVCKEEVK
ncbi:MAG: hypothetical protein KAQ89_00060 [Planctomycetes bacterium]|nr:hypothetical protein [Planctomycetota bacterium]